jgi:succinoglycan biosynthesis transport protein ExoP
MRAQTEKAMLARPEPLRVAAKFSVVMASYPAEQVEALNYLLARASRQQALPRRLALLAPLRQEGVTYLSRALAAAMAYDLGATVCAVELNWHWPSPETCDQRPGLADVVCGNVPLSEALVSMTDSCSAWLPAGRLEAGQRSRAARSPALAAVLAELDRQFDYLILDLPAICATSDAMTLASHSTGGWLVVSQGGSSVSTTQQALKEIAPLPVLGVLMNRVKLKTPRFWLQFVPGT